MGRTPSSRGAKARTAIVLALCTTLGASGCALLIPPSWRGRELVPLAGPISESELTTAPLGNPAELSDERLLMMVEADQNRLVEIASDAGKAPHATRESEELREIAKRLPRLQDELESRGTTRAGASIRHPVIR